MAQSQPGESGLPTSERISPRNTLSSPPPPPQTPVSRRGTTSLPPERADLPAAEPSMASSSPACSNMLAGMCYSTGQGACQQHANTPGDPPFQVGKTRLCSSTHSLPPTADTHMQPSTTASPFRLGQNRGWKHREAAERARGSSRNRPAPAPHEMGVRGKRIIWGHGDAFLLLHRAGTSSPYSSSPRPSNSHTGPPCSLPQVTTLLCGRCFRSYKSRVRRGEKGELPSRCPLSHAPAAFSPCPVPTAQPSGTQQRQVQLRCAQEGR